MYYIINITKWNNFTDHYYANIYQASSMALTDSIIDGTLGLKNMEKLSDTCPALYPVMKDVVERELINDAADLIIHNNHDIPCCIAVFWNGKYSGVRTKDIRNHKALPII
jgi:hypothetical protein